MHAACFESAATIFPGNKALGQCAGVTAFGNPDLEINEFGKFESARIQHLAQRLDKRIKTAVA